MTPLHTFINSDDDYIDIVNVANLSPEVRAEFEGQRELFRRAIEQGMEEVRQRHEALIRAGLMREDLSLVDPPALDTPQE